MQADRSLRSVFVGNIPYDATEEKLRDIFSAVGPVLSFRIVFDRETGKPKGYGFCEYKDQETATSAIRNLNGHDLGGRQLRVDSASNERARDEPEPANANSDVPPPQQLPSQAIPIAKPQVDAHTVINNVMCSLQPEQLFELCKQLRTSILVNEVETKQLLMQNPHLSYAVLQSLVMIKAIDAQTAMATLHEPLMQPAQLQPTMSMITPLVPTAPAPMVLQTPTMGPTSLGMQPQVMNPFPFMGPASMGPGSMGPTSMGPNPMGPMPQGAVPPQPQPQPPPAPIQPVPTAAPADPRLARQHQQQQHQQQQQQQTQQQQLTQPGMSDYERQAFLMQVMNMTEQEIAQVPRDQQEKIYLLRQQYRAQ